MTTASAKAHLMAGSSSGEGHPQWATRETYAVDAARLSSFVKCVLFDLFLLTASAIRPKPLIIELPTSKSHFSLC